MKNALIDLLAVEGRFNAGWGSLAYRERGDRNEPTVVFVHAMSFDQEIWRDVFSLIPSGYRLISFDLRGHGKSDTPTLPYDLHDYASDTISLLDHLQVKDCTLVGMSFGGMVAQLVASLRPELIGRLVLSNTATKIGIHEDWLAAAEEARQHGFTRINTMSDLERLFPQRFLDTSPLIDAIVQRRMNRSVEGYICCCHAIGSADLSGSSSELDQPTLVIGSDEDTVTPPDVVETLAATIPNSSTNMIFGAGHLPCLDAPRAFTELLMSFLRSPGPEIATQEQNPKDDL